MNSSIIPRGNKMRHLKNGRIQKLRVVETEKFQWVTPTPTSALPLGPPSSSITDRSGVLRDFVEGSSFHGILDFGRHHYGKCWRISWIIVMVSFTAAAIFSIKEVISEYIENPTIQNYQATASTTFPLPDISVCPMQRLNDSVLKEMGASPGLIQGLKSLMGNDDPANVLKSERLGIDNQEYDEFRAKNGNITFEQLLHRSGITCDSIVKGCSWGQPCCDRAIPFADMTSAMCYRLKTSRKSWSDANITEYQVTFPGPGSGVQMALSTNVRSGVERSHTRGVMIEFIHPDESASFSYYRIPAGVAAAVHLSFQVTKRINVFGRPVTCSESSSNDPPYNAEGRFSLKAMQKGMNGCFFGTWTQTIYDFCGCGGFPNLIEIPFCEPNNPCPWQEAINNESQKRQARCLPPCFRRSYSASFTYSKFDTEFFFKSENKSEAAVDDDMILLDIYHPAMEYLRVTEVEAYSIMTLISNIGGAVGLWLGASLMSIVQAAFYCAKWVSIRK